MSKCKGRLQLLLHLHHFIVERISTHNLAFICEEGLAYLVVQISAFLELLIF